jgi:predicted kinase
MAKFLMLIGLPGSGKSTWSALYKSKNPNTAIISSDAIREEVFGDVNDQTHNAEVFEIMKTRTFDFLNSDIDVIYDATNLNSKRRINFLKGLPDNTIKIAVLFAVAFNLCKEQNEMRERVVPEDVMNRMYKSFQIPSKYEGFSNIILVGSPEYKQDIAKRQIDEIISISRDVLHDNPHHSSTLGEHNKLAWEHSLEIIKIHDLGFETAYILSEAAKYHDIGKWYCKTFKNLKGDYTDIAHYYGHENVSAYIYLTTAITQHTYFDDTKYKNIILLISNLIANHMIFFNEEATLNKKKELFDSEFWQLLKWLHECDLAAK